MNYSKYISETAADLVTNTKPIFFLEFLSDAISKAKLYEREAETGGRSLIAFLVIHLNYFGISWLKSQNTEEAQEDLSFAISEICESWTTVTYFHMLSYALRAFTSANPDPADRDNDCESCIDALYKIAKVIDIHHKAEQEAA